ncbi:MAG TPA: GNAT family N-acetyltransferase [Variovorax sp.]
MNLTFVKAAPEDGDYLYALCEATMRAHVEAIWGSWNEAAVRSRLGDDARRGLFSILHCEGVRVGAVSVERAGTHLLLAQLYIEPSQQGRRIGTFVVKGLMAEARQAGLPLRLSVLRTNTAARRLYERLGFRKYEETPERCLMEWTADESSTPAS